MLSAAVVIGALRVKFFFGKSKAVLLCTLSKAHANGTDGQIEKRFRFHSDLF